MLEEPVMREHPLLRSIKAQLYDMGAEWAMMSGSGSTIFGVFREKHIAENTLRQMERPGWLSVVTGTLQRGSFDKPVSMYPSPQD
jgi:4-diphosphocytidyl-2-C-methyl-D-erythritol kinase